MSLNKDFFVSDTLHERTVKLPDGSEHPLHFAEIPATEFRRFQMAEFSEDEDIRAGSMAKLIVASLREPDGKPAIKYEQAILLKPAAAKALTAAVLDVNGYGKDAPGKE